MLQKYLEEAVVCGKKVVHTGAAATYIPELAKADVTKAGICVMKNSGEVLSAGDTDIRFTVQSISKIMNLGIAMQALGYEKTFEKVNMEPSGDPFNSMIKLDIDSKIPFNPMINAGAIVIVDLLAAKFEFEQILSWMRILCLDESLELDESVYRSESLTGARNRSIAYLLRSKDVISENVERTLDLYFKLCSVKVTARSLAGFGLVLACDGVDPRNNVRLLDRRAVKVIKTLMFTCGLYDESGRFAVKVGLPSKSGVGGGILTFSGGCGIGVYGPALDSKGNSVAGMKMLEYLSEKLGLHVFEGPGAGKI